MSHTCPGCDGLRTYAKTVPNVKKYGGVEYVSHPATKTLLYPCATCHGSGKVNCLKCADTGYVEEYDYARGEWEGLYPCDCAAGTRMAEQDRIDAEKAAWEATRPNYDELAYANAATGNEPY